MKKGISLIVLVITIIVIIILAGAIILSLVNNNSVLKANEATFKSDVATYNSELAIAISNKYLEDSSFNMSSFNAKVWDGSVNATGTIKEYIKSMTVADGSKFEIQCSKLIYVGDVQIEKDWLSQMEIASGTKIIAPALGVNSVATVSSTVNGAAASFSNPIVPKGFKAINDGATWPAEWNNGLVIEDESGNQFVWVPVDGTNVTYAKWCTQNLAYSSTYIGDDVLPTGVTSESDQVTKYGGFYIARYEAGKENTDTLVSKKSIAVWNNINYGDSKIKSEAMYNTTEVKSGLITGTQWDTTMKWIEKSGKNVTDSITWGNHFDSAEPANVSGFGSLQVTGYSEYWKANNIYDIAGNAWELTNETYKTDRRVQRGGNAGNTGSFLSVSNRSYSSVTNYGASISFRTVLYIM